jgi:ATP-dependent DNA helicase HFM1/MER3
VELVDLVEELSAVPNSDLASRDYRKSHSLHTSIGKDKAVHLPKQKPQFLYGSGHEADLPFLQKTENNKDPFDSGDSAGEDEFPSPYALLKGDDDIPDPFESGSICYQKATTTSSSPEDSLGSLEAAMIGFEDSVMLRAPTPKVNSSFANGVFDFEAFPDHHEEQEMFSSPVMRESLRKNRSPSPLTITTMNKDHPPNLLTRKSPKREPSESPEQPEVKHRRVLKTEPAQQTSQELSVPAWVDEFDSDIIEGLKGFVDFVD